MDISQELLGRLVRADYARRVSVGDDISRSTAEKLVSVLRELDKMSRDIIVVEINSNGGKLDVSTSIIVENLRTLRSPTVGVVYGRCFSAAFPILQTCTKRYAMPSARFLLHHSFRFVKLTSEDDPDIVAEEVRAIIHALKKGRDESIEVIRKKLPFMSREEITDKMGEGTLIDADEALRFKMIDGIIR